MEGPAKRGAATVRYDCRRHETLDRKSYGQKNAPEDKRGHTQENGRIREKALGREERAMKLRPGDIVRVIGEPGTSKVRSVLNDVNGALLETQIGGFRRWNVDDLRLVKRAKDAKKGA